MVGRRSHRKDEDEEQEQDGGGWLAAGAGLVALGATAWLAAQHVEKSTRRRAVASGVDTARDHHSHQQLLRKAYRCARMSSLVYSDDIQEGHTLDGYSAQRFSPAFQGSQVQWCMFRRRAAPVHIAFRGTNNWSDVLTDLDYASTTLPSGVRVHNGVYNLFAAGWLEFLDMDWRSMAAECGSLVITGHSLGGALAMLTAYHLLLHFRKHRLDVDVSCVVFGSPNVFASHPDLHDLPVAAEQALRQLHDNTTLLVCELDLVPRLLGTRAMQALHKLLEALRLTNSDALLQYQVLGKFHSLAYTDGHAIREHDDPHEFLRHLPSLFVRKAADDHKMERYKEILENMSG